MWISQFRRKRGRFQGPELEGPHAEQYNRQSQQARAAILRDGLKLWRDTKAQATNHKVFAGADDGTAMIMRFIGQTAHVRLGTRVTFLNTGMAAPHTITFGPEQRHQPGLVVMDVDAVKRHPVSTRAVVSALMTVDTAARFLRISRLAAEAAVECGELPLVSIDTEPAIDGRLLLAELGVDLTALEQEPSEASL